MNYNFFADRADKIKLLEFIFDETDLLVFDLNSQPDTKVNEYKNVFEISDNFDLVNGGQFAVTFQLWSPRFSETILFRKVNLDPKYCDGHTFRYVTAGLGLIQLYLGGLTGSVLEYCHIGHYSEKRALLWEDTLAFPDKASNWNWKEIERTSRQLKSIIHKKWSVDKIGSLGVMGGASELERQGVKLSYFIR